MTRAFLLFLFVVGSVLAAGCDNTVEPVSNEGAYAVYGTLTSQPEPQFIRVRPLGQPIGTSLDSLDATVTLTNQSNGTTRSLQDSVITFDGAATHNYWSDFEPEPTTTYELTVDGPEGTTRTRATIPPVIDATVDPDTAQSCTTPVQASLPVPEGATLANVRLGFPYEGTLRFPFNPLDGSNPTIRGGEERLRFTPQCALRDTIRRFSGRPTIRRGVPGGPEQPSRCAKLDDPTLYLVYTYLNPERRSGEDSTVAFDPTESRRVDQGTGFFGAVRRDTLTVRVDTTGASAAVRCPILPLFSSRSPARGGPHGLPDPSSTLRRERPHT